MKFAQLIDPHYKHVTTLNIFTEKWPDHIVFDGRTFFRYDQTEVVGRLITTKTYREGGVLL